MGSKERDREATLYFVARLCGDCFEALNRDFRYQLTSIGRPQPSLYIGKELAGNRFKIDRIFEDSLTR
jgi:hypothetical protein